VGQVLRLLVGKVAIYLDSDVVKML